MQKVLILVAAIAALTLHSKVVPSGWRALQANKNTSVIKAEVRGVLHFQTGQGYFITVRSKESFGGENRVWLWISEEKALVRQLQGLSEKQVIAKGELEQMPENVRASVPPHGMFIRRVQIEAAESQ